MDVYKDLDKEALVSCLSDLDAYENYASDGINSLERLFNEKKAIIHTY